MKQIAKRSHSELSTIERNRGGFTLIEILIVIAIIMVIAAMAVPQLMGSQLQAQIKASKVTVRSITKAAQMYAIDHDGEYPKGGQEVFADVLMKDAEYRGQTIPAKLDELPKDAWGEVLFYQYPPKQNKLKPDIWSGGPNREDDGGGRDTDDIGNWPDTTDN